MSRMSKLKKDALTAKLNLLIQSRNDSSSLIKKKEYSIDIFKLIMQNINYEEDLNEIFKDSNYCILLKIYPERECPAPTCLECCNNGKMLEKIIELYNKKGFHL